MSHLLMIATPPFPADDGLVWDDFDRRADAWEAHRRPPLPVLRELLERLTVHYPCVSDLRPDQLDDAVWADGPLTDGLMHDVAVLTIVPARLAAVLPRVLDAARALGLAVYDPQDERVHRP